MLANVTAEMLEALGAKDVADFSSKLTEFISENNRLKSMADNSETISALTKRIEALEAKPNLTEARVSELVTAGVTPAIASWAGSEVGKKAIGAEASRIASEALASVGTVPVKPSPASAEKPADPKAKTFPEIVQTLTANGMAKGEAVRTAVQTNPNEYGAWLQTGGKL
jgi:hypothetical protein